MTAPTMSRDGDVFVLDLGADENVTSDKWVQSMHNLLDEIEQTDGPRALVTTGSGKHYSNGLDVTYMSSINGDEVAAYVGRVLRVVRRIMLAPVPTVAAVNGHAFGMGAFLILAHDQALMRDDRGYVCFPEVHLGMSFPEPLLEIARATVPPRALRQALTTGHRYSGPEAVTAGVVDDTVPLDKLADRAVAIAAALAPTAGPNLATIKRQILTNIASRSDAS